jgi:hypothetical protein
MSKAETRADRLRQQIDRLTQKLAGEDPRVSEATRANWRARLDECTRDLTATVLETQAAKIRAGDVTVGIPAAQMGVKGGSHGG